MENEILKIDEWDYPFVLYGYSPTNWKEGKIMNGVQSDLRSALEKKNLKLVKKSVFYLRNYLPQVF